MTPARTSAATSSEIARLLSEGFRYLRFPEPLESEFRQEHRTKLRPWARLAILVSACTVAGFAVLDHFVLSADHSRVTNIVRFGLHVPAVLWMLIATSRRFYDRWYETVIGVTAPLLPAKHRLRISWRRPAR